MKTHELRFETTADGVAASVTNASIDQPHKIALYGIVSNTLLMEVIMIDCIISCSKHCSPWQHDFVCNNIVEMLRIANVNKAE